MKDLIGDTFIMQVAITFKERSHNTSWNNAGDFDIDSINDWFDLCLSFHRNHGNLHRPLYADEH